MSYRFGALARGDGAATVEHHAGMYLLAGVSGRLATPALESVKSAFYRLTSADAAAASAVCAAAPSLIADAVAVILVAGAHAYIACAGGGRVLYQRGGVTTRVDGTVPVSAGDDLIAATGDGVLAGTGPFFATAAAATAAAEPGPFRNDAIDAELCAATAMLAPAGTFAIAAVRVA